MFWCLGYAVQAASLSQTLSPVPPTGLSQAAFSDLGQFNLLDTEPWARQRGSVVHQDEATKMADNVLWEEQVASPTVYVLHGLFLYSYK